MRFTQGVCSLSLLIIFSSYSAFLNGQKRLDSKEPKGPPATVDSSKSRNSAAPAPAGIPESPIGNPPVPLLLGGEPHQPESIFDALDTHLKGPVSLVVVHASVRDLEINEPFRAGGQEILSTAGSFGDIERFLQVLPGVVSTSDLSNEVVVRGGHPMENLFVVDGIQIPNINHLSVLGTTGGFGPMIDSALIQGLNFYSGGYDARYPERLSSVIEIETLDPKNLSTHAEVDVGIQGAGGLLEKQIHGSDLLLSAHNGLLEFINSNVVKGLPTYENELIRFRRTSG